MKLEVVTPFGAKADEPEVTEVVAPGALGELGVLPGHEPLITTLVPGRLVFEKAGKRTTYAADEGFLQVIGDTVRVITETCLAPDEIDVERAQRALARADETLTKSENLSDEKREKALAARARAQSRLDVAALAQG